MIRDGSVPDTPESPEKPKAGDENLRYRLAMDSAGLGMFEYSIHDRGFDANNSWYEITGLRKGEGFDRFVARVNTNERDRLNALLVPDDKNAECRLELPYEHPLRGPCWLSISGRRTASGTSRASDIRFTGVISDITGKKAIEDAYHEQELIQQMVIENLPVGMLVINPATRVLLTP